MKTIISILLAQTLFFALFTIWHTQETNNRVAYLQESRDYWMEEAQRMEVYVKYANSRHFGEYTEYINRKRGVIKVKY